jgi:hypothetical protein
MWHKKVQEALIKWWGEKETFPEIKKNVHKIWLSNENRGN